MLVESLLIVGKARKVIPSNHSPLPGTSTVTDTRREEMDTDRETTRAAAMGPYRGATSTVTKIKHETTDRS